MKKYIQICFVFVFCVLSVNIYAGEVNAELKKMLAEDAKELRSLVSDFSLNMQQAQLPYQKKLDEATRLIKEKEKQLEALQKKSAFLKSDTAKKINTIKQLTETLAKVEASLDTARYEVLERGARLKEQQVLTVKLKNKVSNLSNKVNSFEGSNKELKKGFNIKELELRKAISEHGMKEKEQSETLERECFTLNKEIEKLKKELTSRNDKLEQQNDVVLKNNDRLAAFKADELVLKKQVQTQNKEIKSLGLKTSGLESKLIHQKKKSSGLSVEIKTNKSRYDAEKVRGITLRTELKEKTSIVESLKKELAAEKQDKKDMVEFFKKENIERKKQMKSMIEQIRGSAKEELK